MNEVEAASGESPAVHLKAVRKRFGFKDTLKGVDLLIPRGTRFVLFGPNGAGKSTILRIVATQWRFEEGSVEVLGHSLPRGRREVRRLTGLVLHDSFLRPELTLEENLHFACDLYGLDRRTPRIGELLERFALASRRHDPVGTFSQGMTKRAGIVRSLLNEPQLWILDEPFSGLDPAGQTLLEEAISDYSGGGRTVLVVTHQEERGRRLADQWARVVDGKIHDEQGAAA